METTSLNTLAVVLGLLAALALGLATAATVSKESRFSFVDLFIGPDGKTSLGKVGQFTALVVSTWGFVYLTLAYKLTEWYYALYMGAWAATHLVSKYLDSRKPPPE